MIIYKVLMLTPILDPEPLQSIRAGIPVTQQRRFDVYPDVSAGKA
jgi:omega-amidase